MELLLALAVITAVIIFGALISLGNERQRRAIDGLREQLILWAIQDLRIKRERLAREVRVEDPIGWLNRIATKIYGFDLKLRIAESFDEPRALICTVGEGSRQMVFTPFSPDDIRRFKKEKRGRLSQFTTPSPLLLLSHRAKTYEASALNVGTVFDMELPLAWSALTGQRVDQMERLWMYLLL